MGPGARTCSEDNRRFRDLEARTNGTSEILATLHYQYAASRVRHKRPIQISTFSGTDVPEGPLWLWAPKSCGGATTAAEDSYP